MINFGSSVKTTRKSVHIVNGRTLLYPIHPQNNIKKDKRNLVRFK